ncbi:uncharacterized protein METZ01_LOCUS358805, partial [marine metagenome]
VNTTSGRLNQTEVELGSLQQFGYRAILDPATTG